MYVVRKHWLIFMGQLIATLFGAVMPYILLSFLPLNLMLPFMSADMLKEVLALLYITWLLCLWMAIFFAWTMYYLNVWIVTNERIIDIHQRGLFSRESLTAELERVQDVTIDTEGILQTLFGFGTLTIHTAGEGSNFIITNARNPIEAREKIMAEHDNCIAHSHVESGL